MSKQLPDDSTHPDNMDEAQRAAMMAELDEEEAGDEGETVAEVPEKAPEAVKADEPAKVDEPEKAEAVDDGSTKAEAAADEADEDDAKPVDRKAFNGVLKDLRITREELKAMKAQQSVQLVAPSDRDFKTERSSLKEQWDNGELDTDEYNDKRDALVLDEADHRAAVRFHTMQSEAASTAATSAWNGKVSAWEADNADFLANPIRKKAVNDLMAELEANPDSKLTDDELLSTVQTQAFEAFNWAGTPAAADPANPRMAAAARAAASASAAPPALASGVGTAAHAVKVDLENMKPGQFKDLPKDVQAELLDED